MLGKIFLLTALVVASVGGVSAQVLLRSGLQAPNGANSVVVADFNRDKVLDLAVGGKESSSAVQVFLGKGDGTFQPPVAYVPGTAANALATADLNHDGIFDLVIADATGTGVTVLLGNGDGTFKPPVSYTTTGTPGAVVLGDFNNDGQVDIAVTGGTTVSVIDVLLGNGDGTFREPAIVTYPPDGGLDALAAGQFTSGGNLDLAVAEDEGLSGEVVQVLLGNGDGTFRTGASYEVDDAESIVVASLRKNGISDLAVAGLISLGPAILLGNGDGTFQQPVYYDLGYDAASVTVALGDMNGDGILDLVSAPTVTPYITNYSAVYIFPGRGDGTFGSPEISYPVASNSFPSCLALADFNGDHQLDATFSDQLGTGSSIGEYVLLNTGTVKFSPVSLLSFANQKHGTTSPPKTVTLTNEGKASLSIKSIKTTGEFGATSTCGKSVAAKGSCKISITFSPKGTGEMSGTVQINDSASSKPQVIDLSGRGY